MRKDNFQEELNEEWRSNGAPREQTEMNARTHGLCIGRNDRVVGPKGTHGLQHGRATAVRGGMASPCCLARPCARPRRAI